MRMLEQGSGVVRRPIKQLVAISGDHDRTIARSPKVNSQRAHPYKIGSPASLPHKTPFLVFSSRLGRG